MYFIQIDTKPEKLGRRAKVDFGYCGDIKSTLQELMPMVEAKTSTDFLDKMRSLHQEIEAIYYSYVEEKGSEKNIHPEYVAYLVDKLADDDAIFTVDTGMSAVWAARYLKAGRNRYLTGSFNHGSMANAMPMAMEAGLSHPDRQVIAFCGDGGISIPEPSSPLDGPLTKREKEVQQEWQKWWKKIKAKIRQTREKERFLEILNEVNLPRLWRWGTSRWAGLKNSLGQ